MSDTIQNISNIAPMADDSKNSEELDPVQEEYIEGKALLEKNELGLAAVALHNALLGFEEQNNKEGIANASNQLGHVCLQKEDYDKALVHYQRAEEIVSEMDDPMSILALSKQLILVYIGTEQYKQAIARCLDLLDLYQANNNPKGTVEIMEQMAEIFLKSNDKSSAVDAYRTIASIHNNFKHKKIAAEFLDKAKKLEESV
jgi:tetratricopeptide (TPR) repeat protein